MYLVELMAAGDSGEDEEEEQNSEADDNASPSKPRTKRQSGFTKPVQLSTNLSEFLGMITCSRTDVTKLVWKYIKDNNLQNPADKRQILCDAKLQILFDGKSKVGMFKMTKYLSDVSIMIYNVICGGILIFNFTNLVIPTLWGCSCVTKSRFYRDPPSPSVCR